MEARAGGEKSLSPNSRILSQGIRGLRGRFLFLTVGTVLAVLLLLAGNALRQREFFLREVQRHLCEEAESLVFLLSDPARLSSLEDVAQVLDRIDRYGAPHQIFLLDAQGQVRFSNVTPSLQMGEVGWGPGGSESFPRFQVMRHGSLWVASCTVPAPGQGMLHLAEPLPQLEGYFRSLILQQSLWVLGLGLFLLLITHLALYRWVLHPLNLLLNALETVGHGRLDVRLPIRSPDEWGRIARTMEASLRALQESQAALEQERARLAFLHRASRALSASSDWPQVVETALDLAMEAAQAQAGLFLSWNSTTGHLELAGTRSLPEAIQAILEARWMDPQTPSRCSRCLPRAARVGEACPLLPAVPARAVGFASVACLHLAYGEQTLGFLVLYRSSEALLPPERHELLQSLAAEITAAVMAARAARWEAAIRAEIERLAPVAFLSESALQPPLRLIVEGCGMAWGALVLIEEGNARMIASWNLPPEGLPVIEEQLRALTSKDQVLSQRPLQDWIRWIPLQIDGEGIGGLLLGHPARRDLSPPEERLAQVAAQALARWIYAAQQTRRGVEAAIWEERRRLARELHDDIAQHLAYLHLKAQKAERACTRPEAGRALPALLREIREDLRDLYTEVRLTLEGLRAVRGPGETLADALRRLVASIQARGEAEVELDLRELPPLTPWEEAHCLRIAQEALANARRHAHARRIRLSLRWEQGEGILEIADDGVGFRPEALPPTAFGLRMMQERAERIGGTLEIQSAPGQGTRIRLRWPKLNEGSGSCGIAGASDIFLRDGANHTVAGG